VVIFLLLTHSRHRQCRTAAFSETSPSAAIKILKDSLMAIGWLAALKIIPWSDVISNAPLVAEGAKKLWKAVAKKPASSALDATQSQTVMSKEELATAAITERIVKMEVAASDLHAQMVASSALIKALAEQNAELINRVETNRVRLLWLAAITVVTTITAAGGLVLAVTRYSA
jgi:hypothetical protein